MSDKLLMGFQVAQKLPVDRQDQLGQLLLDVAEQDNSSVRLTDEQLAEVKRRRANPTPLVPAEEMRAYFKKFA